MLDDAGTPSVMQGLERLRDEVVNFILRMAAFFDDRREQLIFLINNYDLMLSVFAERATSFAATDDFQKQLEVVDCRACLPLTRSSPTQTSTPSSSCSRSLAAS